MPTTPPSKLPVLFMPVATTTFAINNGLHVTENRLLVFYPSTGSAVPRAASSWSAKLADAADDLLGWIAAGQLEVVDNRAVTEPDQSLALRGYLRVV